ncbi:hypothetical protein ACPCIR_02970 [Mycobacterium sp. NPDC051198]
MSDIDVIGEHYGFDDTRGWLVFSHLPDELQRQMDQTAADDWERRGWRPSMKRTRPASAAEKTLLAHLGFNLPSNLDAVVRYISVSVRRVDFPQLQDQLEALR